jgi:hypothetical protein
MLLPFSLAFPSLPQVQADGIFNHPDPPCLYTVQDRQDYLTDQGRVAKHLSFTTQSNKVKVTMGVSSGQAPKKRTSVNGQTAQAGGENM